MYMTRVAVSVFVLGAIVGFGLAAHAADEKPQTFVVCKNQKSVRTLSILPDTPSTTAAPGSKACKVTYTKSGVPEQVGTHTPAAACGSILDHVRNNLEKANWNCKQVSATVTTSDEILKQ